MPVCLAEFFEAGSARKREERRRLRMAFALSFVLHAALTLFNIGRPGLQGTDPSGHSKGLSVRLGSNDAPKPDSVQTTSTVDIPPPVLTADATSPQSPTPLEPASQLGAPATPPASAAPPGDGSEGRAAGDKPAAIPVLAPMSNARHFSLPASLRSPLRFSYPTNLPNQGGRVRVRLLINTKGVPEDIRVVDSAPKGVFDEEALSLLRSAQYVPAYIGTNTLRSYLYLELTFGPSGDGQQVYSVANTPVTAPPSQAPK